MQRPTIDEKDDAWRDWVVSSGARYWPNNAGALEALPVPEAQQAVLVVPQPGTHSARMARLTTGQTLKMHHESDSIPGGEKFANRPAMTVTTDEKIA